jgi:hypothetical protein
LDGGFSANLLYGGDGNDRLFGGEGGDQLAGGDGADIFYCGLGIDEIKDFNRSEGDKIIDNSTAGLREGNEIGCEIGVGADFDDFIGEAEIELESENNEPDVGPEISPDVGPEIRPDLGPEIRTNRNNTR